MIKKKSRTRLGLELEAALREVRAHQKGAVALATRIIEPMSPARVREIRKSVAKSTREFEARFGVPARTIEGWEQGRAIDVAGRVLLQVIAKNPKAVEKAIAA